ncbi:oxidoreductase [Streptomyces sp. NPDC002755]|uniref:oxidoreductase n=1 Tax=Streptomyces sp. NPDC002884 TaxID=3154544 RepID=UPI00332D4341
MELNLRGRSAVVTGAGKGIGLAITQALVAEGVRVTAGARHTSGPLAELSERGLVHVIEGDLATPAGSAALVEGAVRAFGPPDILVNNVGAVRPRTAGFSSVTDLDWATTLEINFLSAVRATREVLPYLLERGSGSVVTVASVNSRLPDPLVIDYSAAKAALLSFSKSLSKELGPYGIRVNTVSPGPVATDLWLGESGVAASVGEAGGLDADDVVAQAAKGSATGRFTRPEEVADLVLLLASDRAGNVTGSDFVIDGGLIGTV